MKKNYVVLLAVLLGLGIYMNAGAQLAPAFSAVNPLKGHGAPKSMATNPHQLHSAASSTPQSYWENDALANDSALGGSPLTGADIFTIAAYPLFPDSSVVFEFSNGNFPTFVHLCGNVFDPLAANMQTYWSGSNWTADTAYSVDSMQVGYVYQRTTTPDIIDTMVVYLYSTVDTSIKTYYFQNNGAFEMNFGITDTINDTLLWKGMAYDYHTNMPKVYNNGAVPMQIFKIPLGQGDSGVVEKQFSTGGFIVPGGQQAVSAVGFIPGYSYSAGDDITAQDNTFEIIYYTENGTGTYPTYFGKGGYASGIKDWNCSEIVRTDERYNLPSNSGWNGNFLPEWAFLSGYPFDEWDISYKVTSAYNVGVKTISANGDTKLYQNQPNPSNNSTVIGYETKSAGPAMLEIRDVTGRVVMEFNEGNQASGKHIVTVDVTKLSQGMYTYTLKTNQESLTRRMVVAK